MFAPVIDAGFSTFGVTADYTPVAFGAETVSVTVIARTEDADISFGGSVARTTRGLFDVRASEIAAPAKGDRISIGSDEWTVRDAPEAADPDRLVWTLRCEKTG